MIAKPKQLRYAHQPMTVADRALIRIRQEMTERHITQDDLAARLNCSQSRVGKILNGGINLRVNDLDLIARAVGISTVEAVRDRGLEFYAEMTPTELRLLERFRQQRPEISAAFFTLLDVRPIPPTQPEQPTPKHRPSPKRN